MLAIPDNSAVLGLCDGEMGKILKTPALAPPARAAKESPLHSAPWLFLLPRPGVLMLADCTVVQRALVPPHLWDVPPPTAPRPARSPSPARCSAPPRAAPLR